MQEPILYVSDPKALHAMLIKDEHIFQEADEFFTCVPPHHSYILISPCVRVAGRRARFVFGDVLLAAQGKQHYLFMHNMLTSRQATSMPSSARY